MSKKEQQIPDNDELSRERNNELWNEGYSGLSFAERFSREGLDRNMERTKMLINAYYFGERFSHYEAYMLCGVGRYWPDFCYHPTEKGYVINFEELNSTTSTRDEHMAFEEWVDENRKEIAQRAAAGLGIEWSQIEEI